MEEGGHAEFDAKALVVRICYSSEYRPPAYEFWGTHSPKQASSEYICSQIIDYR